MAEALFKEGRRLMEAGKYSEACPKFEASVRVQSALGALYQLADCQEKIGRTASAWANFLQVAAAARRTAQYDREQAARTRATELEPRLSKLVITLTANTDLPGLGIARDGAAIDRAALGIAVPVDPGEHLVTASAPGKKHWSQRIKVPSEGATVTLAVPRLEDERSAEAPVKPAPAPNNSPPTAPTRFASATPATGAQSDASLGGNASDQRTIAILTGGVGVAAAVVGAVFALSAKSAWDDATTLCPTKQRCSDNAVEISEKANTRATIANVAFAAGAIGIGGAAVLWFTATPVVSGTRGNSGWPLSAAGLAFRGHL